MVLNEELKRDVPEGWGDGIVSDLGEVFTGGTPSTAKQEYFCPNEIPWLTPKDLSVSPNKYIGKGATDITVSGLASSSAKLIPAGSVVLTTRAPIGYLCVALNAVTTNQGFKSVAPYSKFGTEFVFETVNLMVPLLKRIGVGSTFKEISKEVFTKVKVVIPKESTISSYKKMVFPLSERRKVAEKENQELSALRDWLLPMLMNGQVRVGNIEEMSSEN